MIGFDIDYAAAVKEDVLPSRWAVDATEEPGVWLLEHQPEKVPSVENLYLFLEPEARATWITLLPTLRNVKYLRVKSRTNQETFEAICRMPWLERLHIEWSSIVDLEPIRNLKALTHLELGSSPQLSSIAPIEELDQLVSFGLQGKFNNISKLDSIGSLVNLRGLSLCGLDYHVQCFETLAPLSNLANLVYLSLVNIKTLDSDLKPLAKFRQLRYFCITGFSRWPLSDYQYVREKLTELESPTLDAVAYDEKIQKKYRIK